jgi:uncharacterized protein YkwD
MWTDIFGWFWWLIETLRGGAWYWSHGGLFGTAQGRAEQLAAHGALNHDGFWSVTWPADCPHGYYGEVIGRTNGGEELVFDAWLKSPPHSEVLLSQVYNAIGYGLARAGDMVYTVIHTASCW